MNTYTVSPETLVTTSEDRYAVLDFMFVGETMKIDFVENHFPGIYRETIKMYEGNHFPLFHHENFGNDHGDLTLGSFTEICHENLMDNAPEDYPRNRLLWTEETEEAADQEIIDGALYFENDFMQDMMTVCNYFRMSYRELSEIPRDKACYIIHNPSVIEVW